MRSPLIQLNRTKAAVVLQTIICAAKEVELLPGHVVTGVPARAQNPSTRYRSTLHKCDAARLNGLDTWMGRDLGMLMIRHLIDCGRN